MKINKRNRRINQRREQSTVLMAKNAKDVENAKTCDIEKRVSTEATAQIKRPISDYTAPVNIIDNEASIERHPKYSIDELDINLNRKNVRLNLIQTQLRAAKQRLDAQLRYSADLHKILYTMHSRKKEQDFLFEKRRARDVESIQKRLQGHLSYRLGNVLARPKRTFRDWLLVPFRLISEARQYKIDRRSGANASSTFNNNIRSFWKQLESTDIQNAYLTLQQIESFARSNVPTLRQQREINKVRKQKIGRLVLLESINDSTSSIKDPVAKRICYILHNSEPYASGGYAIRATGLAKGLQNNGFEVIILTRPGYPLDAKSRINLSDIELDSEIDGLRYIRTLWPLKRNAKIRDSGLHTYDYMIASADALEARLRELRPSLVIAASNYHTALPAVIAARRAGIPFIYEVRGLWELTTASRQPDYVNTAAYKIDSLLEAGVARNSDYVFTLTTALKNELISRGVEANQIALLPNSCDVKNIVSPPYDEVLAEELGIPYGIPTIGYIGTFNDYEGLDDLLRACVLLKNEGLVFRVLLVGSDNVAGNGVGPVYQELKRIAAESGLDNWLITPGRIKHELVAAYYSLINVAVFPRKGWPVCEMVSPMKIIEAMAMGKPVLVSSVRALEEIVEANVTGQVFEKDNISALAEQIKAMLSDPSLRGELGTKAQDWVRRNRTWTITAKRASKYFKGLSSRAHAVGTPRPTPVPTYHEEIEQYRLMLTGAANDVSSANETKKDRLKAVYFLHSSLPYLTGGYATRTHGLTRGVLAAGVDILPYTRPAFPNDLKKQSLFEVFPDLDVIDGVEYRRIFTNFNRLRAAEPDYMRQCIEAFETILKNESPDVVHCRSTYLIAAPALIAARRVGIPFVYEVSGLWELVFESREDAEKYRDRIDRMRAFETFTMREADELITLTVDMEQELIARGVSPERITLVPNSVDPTLFVPSEADSELRSRLVIPSNVPIIGYIGSFIDYEGLDDLIRSVGILVRQGVELRLLLVGSGHVDALLREIVAEEGLKDYVILPGRVPHQDVRKYYSIIDVMAYPRKPWEVCETVSPMKPFEAMALEKAVLVSSVKALRDIIQDGVTGAVFEKGNIDSLANRLRDLIDSPSLRGKYGKAARQWVIEHRSWEVAGQRVANVYMKSRERFLKHSR